MRLKITLTLLVILLSLLTYIFYVDPWDEDQPIEDQDKSALASIAIDIDFLRIADSTSGRVLSMQKQDSGWILLEPYEWPANTFAIERILTQLQFLDAKISFEVDRLGKAGAALEEYGLAPPDIVLEFGKGENRHSIGIGNATEVGENLYILSSDKSRIHVVDRGLLDSLSMDLESLRNPRVFKSSIFEANSWNIQLREASNLRTRLSKTGDQWIIETPIRARADSLEVTTMLSKLLSLKSLRILEPSTNDLSLYGLQEPYLRIAVESGQTREALEIGNPIGEDEEARRYAKLENRDTLFEVEIDYLDRLKNAQTALRDRRVFEIDPAHASSLSFARNGNQSFALQKLETGAWDILLSDAQKGIVREKASVEAVEESLSWLGKVRAFATNASSGFEHDAPTAADLENYGLEVPEFSISVTSNRLRDVSSFLESPRVETLLFGDRNREDRSLRYVKLKEKDFVFLVDNDVLEKILSQAFQYRDRRLFDIPEDASLTRVSINRLSNGESLLAATRDEGALPPDLLEELSPPRVKAYLSDAYASTVPTVGKPQSWAYVLKATFEWPKADQIQSKEIELSISELTGGPFLAGGSVERNAVFEFRQSFIDAFSPIVFSREQREMPARPFDLEAPLPSPNGSADAAPQQ